ncbi:hypothetical protein BU14_0115s0012, partial [Porphyra umbilicalis]
MRPGRDRWEWGTCNLSACNMTQACPPRYGKDCQKTHSQCTRTTKNSGMVDSEGARNRGCIMREGARRDHEKVNAHQEAVVSMHKINHCKALSPRPGPSCVCSPMKSAHNRGAQVTSAEQTRDEGLKQPRHTHRNICGSAARSAAART